MTRPEITPLVRAKAPDKTIPYGIVTVGHYRPRSRSRWWMVGLYIIEEDAQGWLWIVGRDELDQVERAPVVIEHGTVGYDRWVDGIARALASPLGRLWSSLA